MAFFFRRYAHPRDLHSFPTRRSSDLRDHLVLQARAFNPKSLAHRRISDAPIDRKSTRLNSSHTVISYAVFCLKKKKTRQPTSDSRKKFQIIRARTIYTIGDAHRTPGP